MAPECTIDRQCLAEVPSARSFSGLDLFTGCTVDLRVTWVCIHDLTCHKKRLENRLSHHFKTEVYVT